VNLDDKIFGQIKNADLIIADISPDDYKKERDTSGKEISSIPIFNKHVMTELGFAFGTHQKNQIIIIYDEYKCPAEDLPIFYKTKNYHRYKATDELTIGMICDSIKSKIQEIKKEIKDKNFKYINYDFDVKTRELLKIATGCKISDIDIFVDIETGQIQILICNSIGNLCGTINVNNKLLSIKGKAYAIDLSNIKEICDELKHIQLMVNKHIK
jgi:hypothetical protein